VSFNKYIDINDNVFSPILVTGQASTIYDQLIE